MAIWQSHTGAHTPSAAQSKELIKNLSQITSSELDIDDLNKVCAVELPFFSIV